ncbi:MAG TPA: hypothetical protein VK015_02505 [Microbacterium sp.]|nr:hypothetical protein [Microbacterium sp.]
MVDAGDPYRIASYRDLRGEGMSRRSIREAVTTGHLFHARRDNYVLGSASEAVKTAVRVGGRVDCVSLMRELGVFVLNDDGCTHVQIDRNHHWLRSARSRSVRLATDHSRVVTHWRSEGEAVWSAVSGVPAAIAQAVLCQSPRAAIATLDSALNKRVLRVSDLREVFERLPHKLQRLRRYVDSRAEAGSETFARLAARTLGVPIELQVQISGVGRVDLVLDGRVIVECDSREFHGGWERQQRDRERDLAAAALGYATLRPTAVQLFTRPSLFLNAARGLLGG